MVVAQCSVQWLFDGELAEVAGSSLVILCLLLYRWFR